MKRKLNRAKFKKTKGPQDNKIKNLSFAEALVKAGEHEVSGDAHKENGRNLQAEKQYVIALSILPDTPRVLNKLGNIYARLEKNDKALHCFRKILVHDPDNSVIGHVVDSLTGQNPDKAPGLWVKNIFDNMSKNFDHHLTKDLGYKIPQKLKQCFDDVVGKERLFQNCIDLGCGTGLTGKEFRPVCTHMTGVDLAAEMIKESRKKEIYDELINSDIDDAFVKLERKFDLFLATDVFIYIGDLSHVFSQIQAFSSPRALFLFSIERLSQNGDYQLLPPCRYAQSQSYIATLAKTNGFSILLNRPTVVRKEKGKEIGGDIFILEYS